MFLFRHWPSGANRSAGIVAPAASAYQRQTLGIPDFCLDTQRRVQRRANEVPRPPIDHTARARNEMPGASMAHSASAMPNAEQRWQ